MDEFEFIWNASQFEQKFKPNLDSRYFTMKAALNMLKQMNRRNKVILETGCMRQEGDWGGGCSTLVFCEFLDRDDCGHLWSVDLSPENCATARRLTTLYSNIRHIITGDSVEYLKSWRDKQDMQPVDLLYLDSFDYPYGELLNLYGGQTDIQAAEKQLWSMTNEEILMKHGDVVMACQEHCRQEVIAGVKLLHEKSIILIDDNSLPGGGKSYTAKRLLRSMGWTCVLDSQQTLWIKR